MQEKSGVEMVAGMLHQKRHEDKYSCLLLWNTEIQAKPDDVLYAGGVGPYLVVTSPPLDRTITFLSDGLNNYHSIRRFLLCVRVYYGECVAL